MWIGRFCRSVVISVGFLSAPAHAANPLAELDGYINNITGMINLANEHIAAVNCAFYDSTCGNPENPEQSGYELALSSCCDDNDQCAMEFNTQLDNIDSALKVLYKNEHFYIIFMDKQAARLTLMRSAASASPIGGAAVTGKLEAGIMKAKKGFIRKFNEKTNQNISRLNEFLVRVGEIHQSYCNDSQWYNRNGLPLYLHARSKFPK